MKRRLALVSAASVAVFFVGCSPESSDSTAGVPMAPPENRNENFAPTAAHLDLGGDYYMYSDVSKRIDGLAPALEGIIDLAMMETPFPNFSIDTEATLDELGLNNLGGMGASSYQLDNGLYLNKTFIQFQDGPQGIFRLIGAEPEPFRVLDYAPAGSDLVASFSFKGTELISLAESFSSRLGGESMAKTLENALAQPVPQTDLTLREVAERANTQAALILDLDTEKRMPVPIPEVSRLELPETHAAIILAGQGWIFDSMVPPPMQNMVNEQEDYSTLPVMPGGNPGPEFFQPVAVKINDGEDLMIATSPAFLEKLLDGNRLRDSEAFTSARRDIAMEGNAITYTSTELYEEVSQLIDTARTAVPPQMSFVFDFYGMLFPILRGEVPPTSLLGVARVTDEGIFSHGTALNTAQFINSGGSQIVVVGLLAAMAIPAFEEVRASSRESAITSNLRQVASAGLQYLLEEGEDSVAAPTLVEKGYFSQLPESVNGESYDDLVIDAKGGTLEVTTDDGTTHSYEY